MATAAREFSAYGVSHWAAIALCVAGAVALVWLGRRQTASAARRFGRVVGGVTAAVYVVAVVYSMVPFSVDRSVPLHLTDLAAVVTAYAWWSQRVWACTLTYYWGLVLSVQAVVSPALRGPDFPHYQYLGFWWLHLVVVWGAVYLTWGRGRRPDWRSYRIAVAVTATWAAVTFGFNRLTGSNYGFLNGKPDTASLLDLLGPWPVYIPVTMALVFSVWALMTWPWTRRGT